MGTKGTNGLTKGQGRIREGVIKKTGLFRCPLKSRNIDDDFFIQKLKIAINSSFKKNIAGLRNLSNHLIVQ